MRKPITALCALTIALATLGTLPASAAPETTDRLTVEPSPFINAEYRRGHNNGGWQGHDGWDDRNDDRDGWYWKERPSRGRHGHQNHFERRGNSYFYNGYRGYREHHYGYRNYNGFWFPSSAFSFSINVY